MSKSPSSLKHYVVITKGGFSQDDAGNDTDNCQIIGIYSAENSSKALLKAIDDNKERGHSYQTKDLILYEATNIKRL